VKTAVSVPDRLFKAADRASKKLKVSRSQLYSMALDEFLRTSGAMSVREKLDEVYGSEIASVDPGLTRLQAKVLRKR
jgi:metal-responsive CopG/Arc/MetJ family transcriptional regulator